VASESQSAKQAWGSIFSSVEYCVIILEDRNRFSHMHKTNLNYTYRCAYFNLHISWADRKTKDSPLNNSKHFPNFSALNVLWFVSVNPTYFNFPIFFFFFLHGFMSSCILTFRLKDNLISWPTFLYQLPPSLWALIQILCFIYDV
jgi:hypothetical protein